MQTDEGQTTPAADPLPISEEPKLCYLQELKETHFVQQTVFAYVQSRLLGTGGSRLGVANAYNGEAFRVESFDLTPINRTLAESVMLMFTETPRQMPQLTCKVLLAKNPQEPKVLHCSFLVSKSKEKI